MKYWIRESITPNPLACGSKETFFFEREDYYRMVKGIKDIEARIRKKQVKVIKIDKKRGKH